MIEGFKEDLKSKYRNIFIVDSMSLWEIDDAKYNKKYDLVLTYDLALYKYIEGLSGDIFYIDHLVSEERMQSNNFLVYDFFKKWHFDNAGEDIFKYKNISFGFALRLEFWNDYTAYIRIYLSLNYLSCIKKENIYLFSNDRVIPEVLKSLNITFNQEDLLTKENMSFYFPISQWIDEKIRPSGLRAFLYKVREAVSSYYSSVMLALDDFFLKKDIKTIFIQEYHPTKNILGCLRGDEKLKVLLVNFSRNSKVKANLAERIIPIYGSLNEYESIVKEMIFFLREKKHERLVLDNGLDLTEDAYAIIEKRISTSLANVLRTLDSCISYLDKYTVDLEILIANIGHVATLFDCVCKNKGIPSYLIINGLLGPEYLDESKYATYINSYSESIKRHYFKKMDNIVVLGDPRMDMYPPRLERSVNFQFPTITIGVSGFNSVDLNSYVAVEFDFMYDVLSALVILKDRGKDMNIIIKVRENGYKKQYEEFLEKFFPSLVSETLDRVPIKDILLRTDFYISIYSQTLFEASCLGIPVVYYKKDVEVRTPPFDGKSELVTVNNINDLVQAFDDLELNFSRYEPFLRRDVMEKYVGFLDGRNLERNKAYIYHLLNKKM